MTTITSNRLGFGRRTLHGNAVWTFRVTLSDDDRADKQQVDDLVRQAASLVDPAPPAFAALAEGTIDRILAVEPLAPAGEVTFEATVYEGSGVNGRALVKRTHPDGTTATHLGRPHKDPAKKMRTASDLPAILARGQQALAVARARKCQPANA